MYQMKMAQRNSSTTAPTSTTCAHNGITSFANGGKAGIGDCGGSAGGVNGVGGVGDCGGSGGAGVNGAGGGKGQAEELSNVASTLPRSFSTVSSMDRAVKHLRKTDAGTCPGW